MYIINGDYCIFGRDLFLKYSQVICFGLTGPHEEIDYSAKLKFSDDEGDEEGEEERTESNNDSGYVTFSCESFNLQTMLYFCFILFWVGRLKWYYTRPAKQ